MDFTVRSASIIDARAISSLVQRLAAHNGEPCALDESYTEHFISTMGSGVLLAEDSVGAIGILSYSIRPNLFHAGPVCCIEELYVRSAARNRGVGRALILNLVRLATSAECKEISVSTTLDNAKAIEFYEDLGLTDRAIVLEKHL